VLGCTTASGAGADALGASGMAGAAGGGGIGAGMEETASGSGGAVGSSADPPTDESSGTSSRARRAVTEREYRQTGRACCISASRRTATAATTAPCQRAASSQSPTTADASSQNGYREKESRYIGSGVIGSIVRVVGLNGVQEVANGSDFLVGHAIAGDSMRDQAPSGSPEGAVQQIVDEPLFG